MWTVISWLVSGSLVFAPRELPYTLTFEVLNAHTSGYRIVHLPDVIGPHAQRRAGRPFPLRAVLVVSASLEDCMPGGKLCSALQELYARVRDRRGLALGVLLESLQRAERTKTIARHWAWRVPVSVDSFGLLRRDLGFQAPGEAVLIGSDGSITRWTRVKRSDEPSGDTSATPWDHHRDEITRAFVEAIERAEEDAQ